MLKKKSFYFLFFISFGMKFLNSNALQYNTENISNSSPTKNMHFNLTKENQTIFYGEEIYPDDFLKKIFLCIVYTFIILSCLIGNMLVIIAVFIVKKLHTQDNASNFLIVSLAVSDLLVGVLVMPYAFYVDLSQGNK